MKKFLVFALTLMFVFSSGACAQKTSEDEFRGMYEEIYDRNSIFDWELKDGILYDFEQDKDLFRTMTVENFEGSIDYNTDSAYITTGLSSMECVFTKNTLNSSQTVKFKFSTGKNGQDIAKLTSINLDVYNPNDYKLSVKPVISSAYASYYFDEQEIAAKGKTVVKMELSREQKDYLGTMSGFELDGVATLEYRVTVPKGAQGTKTFYFDNLCYVGGDDSYVAPAAPQPFTREAGEVNNFNDENRCRFVTPEYEIGIAGYENQNQYVSAEFDSEIKHEGAGSLKFTIKGLQLDGYDAATYGYPALSLRREEQIGATNLSQYNTLSFWVYYDAKEGSGGLLKNPDTVKFVFEFRNNYYPNGPEIVPDLVIPKHRWVNIQINLDDSIFGLRDYTTALRFWTYGFGTEQMDRTIYFDDISLSEDRIPESELNGQKYVMYME